MNIPTPYVTDWERREHDRDNGATASVLQQLEHAVAAMKATPAVRFSPWHRIEFQHNASTTAEVDAIAAGIGTKAEWNEAGTHYEATRQYGPNVAYTVVFITREHMDAYNAHWAAFREQQDTREDAPGREMAQVA